MMLYRKNDAPLDFDFAEGDRAVEGQSGLLRAVRARPAAIRRSGKRRSSLARSTAARAALAQDVAMLSDESEIAPDPQARRIPAT